jgi:60 kDa SS-A/Ro ribonucleoprotein
MSIAKHVKNSRQHVSETPQTQQATADQVVNNAGGYVFSIDQWNLLDRFLILGVTGNSYYVSERGKATENISNLQACIAEDGKRVVDRCVDVSDNGKAVKNDQAIFALAACVALGDTETRKYAIENLPKVVRIGTHFYQYCFYVTTFKPTNRWFKKAVESWVSSMDPASFAYQVVKYPQRTTEEGNNLSRWAMRDAIRLSHLNVDSSYDPVIQYALADSPSDYQVDSNNPDTRIIEGYQKVLSADTAKEVSQLIKDYNLPREVIPKTMANDEGILRAALPNMPLRALMRDLNRLTKAGILKHNTKELGYVLATLGNEDYIRKSRIHPIQVLTAWRAYQNTPGAISDVTSALESMFYKAFENVTPTGKRYLIGLDVSASMAWDRGRVFAGLDSREICGAMAMMTKRTEPLCHTMAFSDGITEVGFTKTDSLETVLRKINSCPASRTDCSLPMTYALQNRIPVDCFIVYTDNETYAGRSHPHEALKKYRKEMQIPAKLIVCATETSRFSIADPNCDFMLDICGFSNDVPKVISEFASM